MVTPSPGLLSSLRIPMRGYEAMDVPIGDFFWWVTNPHEGL